MRANGRLAKVAQALEARGRADAFHIIEAVPVGAEQAAGRGPGLYRDGPAGSLAGLLVYDPAAGAPQIPEGKLAPWGLVIECPSGHEGPPGPPGSGP